MLIFNIFIITLLSLGFLPVLFIITRRFMEASNKLSLSGYTQYNSMLISIVLLIFLIYISRLIFFFNQWNVFELNFDYIIMRFKPLLIISFIIFGLFILLSVLVFSKTWRFEETSVFLYTILFVLFLASSFDIISIFVLLEAVNICTYIIISTGTRNVISIGASLKYIMITIASTCFFLLGTVFLYLSESHFNLINVGFLFKLETLYDSSSKLTCIFGMFLIINAIIIKLGVFPYHNWLIDVYTGFNFKSLLIVSTILKMSSLVVFYNILSVWFLENNYYLDILIQVAGIGSLLIGGIGACFEWKLNRFLAFVGLFSLGSVLLVLDIVQTLTDITVYLYLLVYNLSFIYLIIIFNSNLSQDSFFFLFSQYNLYNLSPKLSLGHLINIFSLINLPPFAGFFPKLGISYLLYSNGRFSLLVILLFSSLLAVFFLIKIFILFFNNSVNISIHLFKNQISNLSRCTTLFISFQFSFVLFCLYFIINII